jgi:outer membrane protein W
MSTKLKKFCRAVCLLTLGLILILGAASPAGAAAKHHRHKHHGVKVKPPCKNPVHRLGAHPPSRLYRHSPLNTAAKLKKAFADKKFQKIVQRVFDEAKLGSAAPNLIGAVAALPDDAQPKDVPVGAKFDWMAYRKHGKPRLMYDACWAGKGPFRGWIFSVPGGPDGDVDLIVPVPCGNISRVQPPTCVLKTDKNGDTVILDLTGSRPGSVPIASYGATPDLPQNPPGVFQVTAPKCDPGANCSPVKEELWVVDAIGLRSASGQCTYEIPATPIPPICKVTATADNKALTFTVDTTGSGVAVKGIAIAGNGPEGGHLAASQPAPGPVTIPYGDQVKKSGNWIFSADVEGQNGLHAKCDAPPVLACAPPTAKIALSPPYNCETRQFGVDVNGSSDHRMVTVTGPGGAETLSGNGPTWTYDVKRSGKYTIDVTADDAICPDNKATASTSVEVAPFGDTARWTFRVFGAYVRASEGTFHETLNGGTAAEERRKFDLAAHHGGFGAGFEYRPLHVCDLSRWGIALDAINSQLDAHFMVDNPRGWGMDHDKVSITPVLLSLNYHFTPGKRADWFVGPSIGYAFLDSVSFNTLGTTFNEKFKDDFTYGINLGVDVPFGAEHNYAFTAGLRQLFLKAKASGASNFSLDVNPTIATAGIAFRFR